MATKQQYEKRQSLLSRNEFIVRVDTKKGETQILLSGREKNSVDKKSLLILHSLISTGAINGGGLIERKK